MNRRQKIIVSITGIFIVLLALVGLTYAYFLTRIRGNNNNKSISVTTANLELVYGNDDGSIIGDGEIIEPGKTFETKTFTVTNNGNAVVDNYAVILEDVKTSYATTFVDENDDEIEAGTTVAFKRSEDFEIAISCKITASPTASNIGKDCTGYTGTLPLMDSVTLDETYITNGILVTNSIEVGETQTYSVVLKYIEANTDQSADMNKKLEGKFNIIDANNTLDITGTLENASGVDAIVTNSTRRVSQINNDGSYKIVGLEADIHSIKKKVGDTETEIGKISIVKGKTAGVGTTTHNGVTIPQITITDASRTANIDINITSNVLTTDEEIKDYNPFKENTFAYKIYKNKAIVDETKKLGYEPTCIQQAESVYDTAESWRCGSIYEVTNSNKKISDIKTIGTVENISDGTNIDDMGLFKTEDDYGTSYIFRGTIKNNYVNFAGFTWKIIRINGDGSIRLLLNGTLSQVKREGIDKFAGGTTPFSDESYTYENADIGYMRGIKNGTNYDDTHKNINNSYIKNVVDLFYETYIENESSNYHYEQYLTDTLFCGDKTRAEGYTTLGYGNKVTYYAGYDRLSKNIKLTPTLKCASSDNDTDNLTEEQRAYSRYTSKLETNTTTSKGILINNDLSHPIALLSGDELVMSGAYKDIFNTIYYISSDFTKDGKAPSYDSNNWLTMTPIQGATSPSVLGGYPKNGQFISHHIGNSLGVRPVINLKGGLKVTGDGTQGNPYVVE